MQTIKEIRQSTGLSQAQFCEVLNIPKRTLQDWEQGIRAGEEVTVNVPREYVSTEGYLELDLDGILETHATIIFN